MTDLRHANKHFIIGVIILGVGVILLLDQLGFTDANEIFRFWPLILIYFGVQKLITAHNMVSRFWGGFITLLGISFQLEALGLRGIRLGTIWPVFLICAGILMVLKHYERSAGGYFGPPAAPPPPQPPPPPPPPGVPPGPESVGSTVGSAVGSAVRSAVDSAVSSAVDSAHASDQQASVPPGQSTADPSQGSGASSQPPPPNCGAAWDRNAWRQQKRWEKFQRRMDRTSNQFNNQWQGAQSNWQGGANWTDSSQPHLDDVYIFWGGRRRILSKNFIGGDIVAIFGGFEIDLTQADFPGDQVEIETVAIFGGGELRVPPNWEVIVENVGIFGGTSDRTWHPNSVPAAAAPAAPAAPIKRLIVKGVAIFGGLTIKN